VPAAQLPTATAAFSFRAGGAGSVNLNSTTEQVLLIPHGAAAKPTVDKVILVDVVQDSPAIDASPVRWAAGIRYTTRPAARPRTRACSSGSRPAQALPLPAVAASSSLSEEVPVHG
jgi:hypothetical protein